MTSETVSESRRRCLAARSTVAAYPRRGRSLQRVRGLFPGDGATARRGPRRGRPVRERACGTVANVLFSTTTRLGARGGASTTNVTPFDLARLPSSTSRGLAASGTPVQRVAVVVGARPNFVKIAPVYPRPRARSPIWPSRSCTRASTTTARCPARSWSSSACPRPPTTSAWGRARRPRRPRRSRRRRVRAVSRPAGGDGRAGGRQLDARRHARRGQARRAGGAPGGGPALAATARCRRSSTAS